MNRSRLPGAVFGLFVVAFGVLLLGKSALGWDLSFLAGTWWTLVIIAVAILGISRSGCHFWNVLILIIGVWLFLSRLGILTYNLFPISVALLVVLLGVWIITRSFSHNPCHVSASSSSSDNDDFPEYENIFSDSSVKNDSKMFKGGRINSTFGRMRVDLSDIHIQSNAVIDVSSVFATLEIIIPRNTSYKTNVTPVFGSFINNAPVRQLVENEPYIEIKGAAVFGSIVLK